VARATPKVPSPGFTLGTPSSHILGSSFVGTVAGPSGHVHTNVCCRHRTPSATNARVLWLTCVAGTSVRTTDGSSACAWWTASSCGCGIGCAVDSSVCGCASGRCGLVYRGVGGRAGLHGGVDNGAPPSLSRASSVSHSPS